MANTENLGVALARGYQIGRTTGGKLSGLGQIIGKVADRLKSQRELGEQLNLLGQTERIKSQYEPWKPKTKEEAIELAKAGRSSFGFWDEETGGVIPTTPPTPVLPPAPTGKFNPLRMLPGYASYGGDKRSAYNALRSRGISETEAKRRLGIQ